MRLRGIIITPNQQAIAITKKLPCHSEESIQQHSRGLVTITIEVKESHTLFYAYPKAHMIHLYIY